MATEVGVFVATKHAIEKKNRKWGPRTSQQKLSHRVSNTGVFTRLIRTYHLVTPPSHLSLGVLWYLWMVSCQLRWVCAPSGSWCPWQTRPQATAVVEHPRCCYASGPGPDGLNDASVNLTDASWMVQLCHL